MDKHLIKEIISWDVTTWKKALYYWERHMQTDISPKYCLDIGAREGGLSLWLAMKGHHVLCSDIQDTQSRARVLHQRHTFSGKIDYQDINACELTYSNTFDIIIFKSVLGAIGSHENKEAIQTSINNIHRALKPGGQLLFAENLSASYMHTVARKHFTSWGERWYYPSLADIKDWLTVFNTYNYRCSGFLSAFGRNETQRNILAHLDSCIEKLVPHSKRLIVYGVAVK